MTDASIEPGDNTDDNDSYGTYSVDAEDQPQGDGESMSDDRGLTEPLDEGYSPPERWSAAQGYGNTPLEEAMGEDMEQRLAQEVPEPDPYAEAAKVSDVDDLDDGEVGDARSGRLVADEGSTVVESQDMDATDVGIDGAGASAEEAAVHEVPED
ncbi:hypothetical protein GCM10011519_32530 [Marmoricola endophyticus]|uniref:DUF5709 domain-containing protein n=1 Tax=Marmoricola endophyticus TaxID=2040280 RepID=A0A917BTC2_9ACTN|nr:DUF5709 domain-containing protein [Marmoricola endophyticus]GGF56077.1 hypothetical protein GCM10011519_32530 [Marmoricola endophyticus]